MDVFVVTRPDYFEGEAQRVNQLFRNGMQVLHIRKPGNDPAAFRQLMKEIEPVFYDRIVIHQHHELATAFSLIRLHYPEKKRPLAGALGKMKDAGYILSTSIHDLSALKDCAAYDYVFYGPVFNSISKPGYESVLAADITLPVRKGGPQVIAIGGVSLSKLQILKNMNFDGAALLGAVW